MILPETSDGSREMEWQQYELEREQRLENARSHAATLSLEEIDVAHWDLMRFDTIWPYFERLRRESPVYYHHKEAHTIRLMLQRQAAFFKIVKGFIDLNGIWPHKRRNIARLEP